ncbi:hypothetical protein AXK57_21885 [Tsukamurella pulmonis]|uniref:type IV secretory system conjugative DNA transfer family protein n=1 Tax=Tsukamurella pulmonis TaxID=47312 RepID=UPI00079698FE|nr:type IV secretory system conjugative DNA transfer family protein [Tsukamurella pulmonis]KXP11594.1 hypothetical protein AXK57_21885 [Tsukamurella pulmonis]
MATTDQTRTTQAPRTRSRGAWWMTPAAVGILGAIFSIEVGGPIAALTGGGNIPDLLGPSEVGAVAKGLLYNTGDPAAAWTPALGVSPTHTWVGLAIAAAIYGAIALYVTQVIEGRRASKRAEQRGFAGKRELTRRRLTRHQAVAQAKRTTPRLEKVSTRDIDPYREAVFVGHSVAGGSRDEVFIQHRDGVLVEGPTGSGKTNRVGIPRVWDAPGSVITTTTKADVLAATVEDRLAVGHVEVFDPEDITGWPNKLRWSILGGCEDPDVAIRRAKALVQAKPMGDTKNASYWDDKAATLMHCYLHAAALDERSLSDVRRWTSQRQNQTVLSILREGGRDDWADELDQILGSRSESTDDMIGSAARLLAPLQSPALSAAMEATAEQSTDLHELLFNGTNTLYLQSTFGEENSSAAFTSVLAAEMYHLAHKESQRRHRSNGKLDPNVRMVLDECNNVAPIPALPHRITDSGGRGIEIWAMVHNELQNKSRWGQDLGRMFTTNSPVRLILPGLGDPQELNDIAQLTDEAREWVANVDGHATLQTNKVMTGAAIRQMDEDRALMLYRGAAPIILHMPTLFDFPDSKAKAKSSQKLYSQIVESRKIPAVSSSAGGGFTAWSGRRR